jgi:hypothetical protein
MFGESFAKLSKARAEGSLPDHVALVRQGGYVNFQALDRASSMRKASF